MTDEERHDRNVVIVAAKKGGASLRAIGRGFDIAPSTVSSIIRLEALKIEHDRIFQPASHARLMPKQRARNRARARTE